MTNIECLKCIVKCLYQLDFRFGQFVDCKLTYLRNYLRFCNFDPFMGPFLGLMAPFFIYTLTRNKLNLTTIECLKCIIKCVFQLVYKFSQFLDFKLTYLLNYWRFCDFDPFMGLFSALWLLFHTLRLSKGKLTTIECLKCIIKCLYQGLANF